jgi:hypothetical protein
MVRVRRHFRTAIAAAANSMANTIVNQNMEFDGSFGNVIGSTHGTSVGDEDVHNNFPYMGHVVSKNINRSFEGHSVNK